MEGSIRSKEIRPYEEELHDEVGADGELERDAPLNGATAVELEVLLAEGNNLLERLKCEAAQQNSAKHVLLERS